MFTINLKICLPNIKKGTYQDNFPFSSVVSTKKHPIQIHTYHMVLVLTPT